jgi:hypothetical protein
VIAAQGLGIGRPVYELRRLEIKSKVNEKTTYDRRASVRELVVWAEKPTYNSSNATID